MGRKVNQGQEQIISSKIKALRIMRGIKIKELAHYMGISCQQVYKYEKGINRVSASSLIIMANKLMVPIQYFYN